MISQWSNLVNLSHHYLTILIVQTEAVNRRAWTCNQSCYTVVGIRKQKTCPARPRIDPRLLL